MKSPSKVQKLDAGIITISSTERLTFLLNSWIAGLWRLLSYRYEENCGWTYDRKWKVSPSLVYCPRGCAVCWAEVAWALSPAKQGPLHIKSACIKSKLHLYGSEQLWKCLQKLLWACLYSTQCPINRYRISQKFDHEQYFSPVLLLCTKNMAIRS